MTEKLNEVIEHAELIQKLTTLLPPSSKITEKRISSIVNEAEMIKQLAQSLKEDSED